MSLRALKWLAWREFVSRMRGGVGAALSVAYVSVSAVYTFTLYPYFVEGVVTLKPLFEISPLLLALLTPTLTLDLIAEERRSGQLDTWLALPLSYPLLLLGRLSGAWLLLTLAIAMSALIPLCLNMYCEVPWGIALSGYLATLLAGTQLLCIGLWSSVWARSPLSAWLTAFVISFGFYLIGLTARFLPPWLGEWSQMMSLEVHFSRLARGVLDSRDLLYFVVMICFWFMFAVETLRTQVNRSSDHSS